MSGKVQTPYRSLSEPFLAALEQLADAEQGRWWCDALEHPDLILAVRQETVNVYYRGASLFRVSFSNGRVVADTHAKYLVRQRQGLVRFGNEAAFSLDPAGAVWTAYEGKATLTEMLRAAAALAGAEKTGLHRLVQASPNVIDVEIALSASTAAEPLAMTPGADGGEEPQPDHAPIDLVSPPARARQDRLDAASLEAGDEEDTARLVFHEVKHAANTELRAAPGREPAIFAQLTRYRATLAREADRLAAGYPAVCRALVRLHEMRNRVRHSAGVREADLPWLDALVTAVAAGERRLEVDTEPRLIVFGFDADQRDGVLGAHLSRLRSEYGLRVHAVGSPTAKASAAFR